MNQHNGWLLEGQIERNQQALEMLKPHQEPTLYGANGQTSTPIAAVKDFDLKIISGLHCRPECIVTPSGGQIL